MKQHIERTYHLTVIEAKRAMYDHLKSLDRPVPNNVGDLTVTWSADGDVHVKFYETIDFEKTKAA